MTHDVALLPGDGIGREVVPAAVSVLEDAAEKHGFSFDWTEYDWNARTYLETGELLPDDAIDRLGSHDAILHGAMGHPDVSDVVTSRDGPIAIRQAFDHFVNLRPVRLYNAAHTPLKEYGAGDIDIAWFRENTEGEYVDVGGRIERGGETEMAIQNAVFTRKGVERVIRAAFEKALERDGKVTSITKSNALPYGPVFWDEVFAEVSEEYPEIETEELLVDAANMDIVRRPEAFDVVVSSNLFGDIVTDLTAAVTGGLGVAPSANINPESDAPGMFEPVHGSAPDIAGQGIANPLAAVLSGALLLEDLGEEAAAETVQNAVKSQLSDDDAPRTPDLGGETGTEAVVADLRDRL